MRKRDPFIIKKQFLEKVSCFSIVLKDSYGYEFKNMDLLFESLVHSSLFLKLRIDNQRLEFLGDRVLGLVISNWLYEFYKTGKEGALSQHYNKLVCAETCSSVAMILRLEQYVFLEKKVVINKSILADACESLLAAIFLDSNLAQVEGFIRRLWHDFFYCGKTGSRPSRTIVQEWAQKQGLLPEYLVDSVDGPAHNPLYKVRLVIKDFGHSFGHGSSKHSAQQDAATAFVQKYGIVDE